MWALNLQQRLLSYHRGKPRIATRRAYRSFGFSRVPLLYYLVSRVLRFFSRFSPKQPEQHYKKREIHTGPSKLPLFTEWSVVLKLTLKWGRCIYLCCLFIPWNSSGQRDQPWARFVFPSFFLFSLFRFSSFYEYVFFLSFFSSFLFCFCFFFIFFDFFRFFLIVLHFFSSFSYSMRHRLLFLFCLYI